MPRRRRRGTADTVASAKRGQRRIRDGGAESGERIVHAPEMPFIAGVKLQDLLAPGFGEFRAHQRWHRGAAGADGTAHRVARNSQGARDPAAAVALGV
jgi:hypothetical protein